MIIAIVPSPLRFPKGTIMYGSTGNTVLPDYLLGENVQMSLALNKTIGTDFILPDDNFYKVYAIMAGVLHEYTMYRTLSNYIEHSEPLYIPISVKQYYQKTLGETFSYSSRTYLFLNGITLLLDLFECNRDYTLITASQLMKYVNALVANPNAPLASTSTSITVDYPEYIAQLLEDIGQAGLNNPEATASVLRYINIADSAEVTLVHRVQDDYISIYGCTGYPYIPESRLMASRDPGLFPMYENLAQDYLNRPMEDLMKLDLSTQFFYEFEFDRIIGEFYCLPYNNIYLEVTPHGLDVAHYMLMNYEEEFRPEVQVSIPQLLHHALIYHNQTHEVGIAKVTLCRNWLDELYFTIYFQDGAHMNFYLNMAAYHLYTPSLIRLHVMK